MNDQRDLQKKRADEVASYIALSVNCRFLSERDCLVVADYPESIGETWDNRQIPRYIKEALHE